MHFAVDSKFVTCNADIITGGIPENSNIFSVNCNKWHTVKHGSLGIGNFFFSDDKSCFFACVTQITRFIVCFDRTSVSSGCKIFQSDLRYDFGTTSVEGVSWNEQYVDIPLMFDFGYSFSDSFRFFAFTGPSISLGISSNMKSSGVKVNMYEFTGEYLDGVADYGRFDLMFGYGIGADICGRVRIKAALDHGLLNRMKNNLGSVTHRNLIRLGAAYLF